MARAGDFALDVADEHGSTVVRVRGELDMATSSELESALERTQVEAHVVVDLTDCEFLDSSALRVLLTRAVRAEDGGGRMSLVVPAPSIRRVLEIANVESKVAIHATLEAAL